MTKAGKESTRSVVYIITGADATAAAPATLVTWAQCHWAIENSLHWVRDVTFDEDRPQAAVSSCSQVMATIRNIAHAIRHHSYDLDRPLQTLLAA